MDIKTKIYNLLDVLDERGNILTIFEYLPEVNRFDISITASREKYKSAEMDIGTAHWNKHFQCYCFCPDDGNMKILPEEIRDVLLLLDVMNEKEGESA